jgi:hypothetical protein
MVGKVTVWFARSRCEKGDLQETRTCSKIQSRIRPWTA